MYNIKKLLFFLLCNSSMLYSCWCVNEKVVAPVVTQNPQEKSEKIKPSLDNLLRDGSPFVARREHTMSKAALLQGKVPSKPDIDGSSIVVTDKNGCYVVSVENGRYRRPVTGKLNSSAFLEQTAKYQKAILNRWTLPTKDSQESWFEDFPVESVPVVKENIPSMLSYRAHKK